MKVAEVCSHLNGQEWLLVHRPTLWEEILSTISFIDASEHRTKVSKEKTMRDKLLYSPTAQNKSFEESFTAEGWAESRTNYWVIGDQRLVRCIATLPAEEQKRQIEEEGLHPIASYNQTDFVKDRVAVEIQFGKYSFIAYDLFVKHLGFFIGDEIDVGVENRRRSSAASMPDSGPEDIDGAPSWRSQCRVSPKSVTVVR